MSGSMEVFVMWRVANTVKAYDEYLWRRRTVSMLVWDLEYQISGIYTVVCWTMIS